VAGPDGALTRDAGWYGCGVGGKAGIAASVLALAPLFAARAGLAQNVPVIVAGPTFRGPVGVWPGHPVDIGLASGLPNLQSPSPLVHVEPLSVDGTLYRVTATTGAASGPIRLVPKGEDDRESVPVVVIVKPPPPDEEHEAHHHDEEDGGEHEDKADAGDWSTRLHAEECPPPCSGGAACRTAEPGSCHVNCVPGARYDGFDRGQHWNLVLDRVLLKPPRQEPRQETSDGGASPTSSAPPPIASEAATNPWLVAFLGANIGALVGLGVGRTRGARGLVGPTALFIGLGIVSGGAVAWSQSPQSSEATSAPSAALPAPTPSAPSPSDAGAAVALEACGNPEVRSASVCFGNTRPARCVAIADTCAPDGGDRVAVRVTTEDLLKRAMTVEVRRGDSVIAHRTGVPYPSGLTRRALCIGGKLEGFVDDSSGRTPVARIKFWIEPTSG
jgi:hypothetical protein